MEHLRRQASVSFVVHGDAIHAREHRQELEMQVWRFLKRLGPIRANRRLATQRSRWLSDESPDDGRRHFEVVLVVLEDAIEIVRVPRSYPLLCKVFGEIFIHEARFLIPTRAAKVIIAATQKRSRGQGQAP